MADDEILLSEWAGVVDARLPRLLGSSFQRKPCPICGHPTGDCTHDVPGGIKLMAQTEKDQKDQKAGGATREGVDTDRAAEAQQKASHNVSAPGGDDAIVIGTETPLSSSAFEEADQEKLVTLSADVYEEFYFPDTKRPSYRLLFNKGQVVKQSVIDGLNERVEARKAFKARQEAGELDEKNPAEIDSTTLASGTYPGIGKQVEAEAGSKK